MKQAITTLVLVGAVIVLGGCQKMNDTQKDTLGGAVIGAGAGALIGAAAGNVGTGAAIGAAAGAVGGALISD